MLYLLSAGAGRAEADTPLRSLIHLNAVFLSPCYGVPAAPFTALHRKTHGNAEAGVLAWFPEKKVI